MSIKSKLGKIIKIAAPIAAMAIPGLGPAASMALGGIGSFGGSMLEGDSFGQSMLNGALGAAPGALKKVGTGSFVGPNGNTGIAGGINKGGGWRDILPDIVAGGAKAIDTYGKTAANNRGAELSATMDQNAQNITADDAFQRQLLARSAEDRAGQNNAWKQLQQAGYVAGRPTAPVTPGFSPYTRDIPMPSEDVLAGATALVSQNRDSLMSGRYNTNGGAPLPMPVRSTTTVRPGLMQPGTGERIANVAGPALGMWDLINKRKNPPVLTTQRA